MTRRVSPLAIAAAVFVLTVSGAAVAQTLTPVSLPSPVMDGGAPLKRSVAGIAMGLVKEGERVAILSDILGNEDHLGDMDFKVAGTRDGITAFQMDIKIRGISLEIMRNALEQAREGRMHIIGEMEKVLAGPRPDLAPFAPRLTTLKIPVDLIGAVIGPGGKVIRGIVKESGAEVNIEDDGTIVVAATSRESADKAIAMINSITEVPEVGKVYRATVKKVVDFGAFVEFLPGKEGRVHVSQLDVKRVANPSDVVKVGDVFDVKITDKDEQGRYKLSRKVLLQPPSDAPAGEAQEGEQRDEGRPRHHHHRDRNRH